MIEAFRDNGLNTLDHNTEINVSRLETIISSIYYQLNKRLPSTHQISVEQSISLLLNFMIAAYDRLVTLLAVLLNYFSLSVRWMLPATAWVSGKVSACYFSFCGIVCCTNTSYHGSACRDLQFYTATAAKLFVKNCFIEKGERVPSGNCSLLWAACLNWTVLQAVVGHNVKLVML